MKLVNCCFLLTKTVLYFIFVAHCVTGKSHSSVWCHGSHQDHRHCSFSNLCYSSYFKQFIFFHSAESSISGIDSPEEQRHMVKYSPIEGLDAAFFDYVVMPASAFGDFSVHRVEEPTIIVKRWNAEDILHVVHDDLIPIFLTLKHMCFGKAVECSRKYSLAFVDDGNPSSFNVLYQFFSEKAILFLDAEKSGRDRVTCFSKALIGLDDEALWYDHGLSKVQHSLDTENVRATYLEEFRAFVLKKLAHTHSAHGLEYPNIVFLQGKDKNQIANHDAIVEAATVEFKPKSKIAVSILNTDEHSAEHIFRTVSKASVLVGPHGSHMIAGIFLPQNGGIMEIFPYALDPETFTFVSVMASIRGIAYRPLATVEREHSTGFPNRQPEAGGLAHLEQEIQESILKMSNVGSLGYRDPAYLYRLFQHTKVDLTLFTSTMGNLLRDITNTSKQLSYDEWIIPSNVFGAECKVISDKSEDEKQMPVVRVTWQAPLNLEYIPHHRVVYEILVESESAGLQDFVREHSTQQLFATFPDINLKKANYLKIWITAVLDSGIKSMETFFKCSLDKNVQYN